jgi:hypothetical protein
VQDTAKAKKEKKGKKGKNENGETSAGGAQVPKTPRTPAEDSARVVKRGENARKLRLFSETTQLPFTLIADYGRISKDRDSTSTKRYPGTLVVADDKGVERRIPVALRTRGHFRLQRRTCNFVNLLVIFPDSGLKGTPFQGQKSLKLGSHCQGDSRYESILLKEYLAYRIFNVVSERSFRARLSMGTYVDSASGKQVDKRTAMWIENEDDVAARNFSKIRAVRGALFDDIDAGTIDLVSLFEYAIGNTDFSIYALHNTRLAQASDGTMYTIPYDFDFSGLVSAPYASPDPQLPIKSVRIRLFRGPCRKPEEFAPAVARFNEKKEAILALFDEVPDLRGGDLKDAREFMDDFFKTVAKPNSVKNDILDFCVNKPGV